MGDLDPVDAPGRAMRADVAMRVARPHEAFDLHPDGTPIVRTPGAHEPDEDHAPDGPEDAPAGRMRGLPLHERVRRRVQRRIRRARRRRAQRRPTKPTVIGGLSLKDLRPPSFRVPPPDPVFASIAAVTVLPIVVAVGAGVFGGWHPVGDDATLAVRAGNVLGGHIPLVGMPSRLGSVRAGLASNHPGPFEAWLLAVPAWLLGNVGILLTVAAVNIASVVTALGVAWRRAGRPLTTAVAVVVAVLCWSLGPTIIRDPLHTHVVLFPLLALVALCWDVRLGRHRSLIGAALVATWVVQAHALYIPIVIVLLLGTLVLVAALPYDAADSERNRSLAWAGAVTALGSVPLLIDQVNGSGNLGDLRRLATADGLGLGTGLLAVVRSIGFLPAFLRTRSGPSIAIAAPTTLDWLIALATVAAMVWLYLQAVRRSDELTRALLEIATLGLAAAAIAVGRIPDGGGILAADSLFLLWPVTAVVWLAIGWAIHRTLPQPWLHPLTDATRRRIAEVVGAIAVVLLVVVASVAPPRFGGAGERLADPISRTFGPIRTATGDVDIVEVHAEGAAATLYVRPAVRAVLQREGIDATSGDANPADDEARSGLWLVSGPTAGSQPVPNTRLIARVDLVDGGADSDVATRRFALRGTIDDARSVRLHDGPRVSAADARRQYPELRTLQPDASGGYPAADLSLQTFLDLWSDGLVASPSVDADLVRQVRADARGRRDAVEDLVLSVWYRDAD